MFKKLTPKQKKTIEHLKDQGIIEPMKIIEFCVKRISLPSRSNHRRHPENKIPPPFRKHSKQHYQGIIDYLAQGNPI